MIATEVVVPTVLVIPLFAAVLSPVTRPMLLICAWLVTLLKPTELGVREHAIVQPSASIYTGVVLLPTESFPFNL